MAGTLRRIMCMNWPMPMLAVSPSPETPSSSSSRFAIDTPVATVGQNRVNPFVYFRPIAQPISNRPASRRYNHAITHLGVERGRPHEKRQT
jgi:hypothetical protein